MTAEEFKDVVLAMIDEMRKPMPYSEDFIARMIRDAIEELNTDTIPNS